MSDGDSFLDEVTEEVRRDALYQKLMKYRWVIGGVLIVVLGGAAGNEWWKASTRAAAEEAGLNIAAAAAEPDAATRAQALNALSLEGAGPALLAQFYQAGAEVEAGEAERAADILRQIAASDAADIYRDLARLQLVMVGAEFLPETEKSDVFDALVSGSGGFRGLALEQRALDRLSRADRDGALEDLQAVLLDQSVQGPLRSRVERLIRALGEEPASAPAEHNQNG